MREDVRRSLKLNRDIKKLLEQAVKVDRAIKIGWNRDGDEIPKVGEMGICPALPKGGRVRILGELGDAVAIMGTGGSFTLVGSAGDWFGAWNQGTSLVIERRVGNSLGFAMSGGRLVARDGAGDDVGAQMTGGLLVVRGDVGTRVGGGMSGGTIVIHGDVGSEPGVGMTGGKIIINGRCPNPGDGVEFSTLSSEDLIELNKKIEDSSLVIPSDAVCLIPNGKKAIPSALGTNSCKTDWTNIGLVPSDMNTPHLQRHSTIDTMVLIGERSGVDPSFEPDPVGLHLPLLPFRDSGKDLKSKDLASHPFLVRTNPRDIDMMLIDSENISTSQIDLSNADGVILNLGDFPPLTAPALDGILTALRSMIGEGAPFMIMGNISAVERLHLSAAGAQVDGAIVTLDDASGTPAAASLPKTGRSAASAKLTERGISTGFNVIWNCTGTDLVISRCSGAEFLIATPPNDMQTPAKLVKWLRGLQSEMNNHMARIGTDSIEKLARNNLRALDSETASISGLRLTGYERPLPHWFAS
ncbi:MAG TPA: hypothetical protein EYQ53_01220 [Candidatus Poseidoniales archaeon]|jgi:hypothetical protein|nr:MAG: hypothetical protein CXT69_00340 [Euryarchaeota archaeon]HIG02994.1 hypothetical protein [Candidatus Poseidoniales archaeon]HIK79218.1 hypothetical protein [Candidatus Poseidoniales archaeon]